MINPVEGLEVGCTWQCHIEHHNSDLGDDFPCGVGRPIPAPFAGTVVNYSRAEPAPYQALWYVIITSDADPSVAMEIMHLSKRVPNGHYAEGAIIGYSGGKLHALGSGQATGPHIHINGRISGKLVPYTTVFYAFSDTGGTTPVPAPVIQPPFGDTMNIVYETLNASGNHYVAHLIADWGEVDAIDNQQGWAGPPAAWVPNPLYVIYVQVFDPRPANINPILTLDQMTLLKQAIATRWKMQPGGSTGTPTDLKPVLDAIAAVEAQIKALPVPPTHGTIILE